MVSECRGKELVTEGLVVKIVNRDCVVPISGAF